MTKYALPALTLTLALAAPAVAATPKAGTFTAPKGKVERGYDLKFKVSGTKITALVAHVLETCDGSTISTVTTVGPDLTWKIKNGRFSGRKKETEGDLTLYTTLKGRFVSRTKVVGIVRQESIVAGSTCDTYELDFTALR